MMYWGSHMSAVSWIFSIFGTVIILALIVVAIIWLVSDRRLGREASAGEILDRRLAGREGRSVVVSSNPSPMCSSTASPLCASRDFVSSSSGGRAGVRSRCSGGCS